MNNKFNTKILILAVATMMILISFSGLTVSEKESKESKDYTHTVMVEVGTGSWCSSCPAANAAWHDLYEGGLYDFEYVELVDSNSVADNYLSSHFNIYWFPTSYYDGGAEVYSGSGQLLNSLNQAGARTVYDIDVAITSCKWDGTAQIEIDIAITNNEASTYDGTARIYILEKVSTLYDDYYGFDYNHAFLDFGLDETISISPSDTYSTHVSWDGSADFPGFEVDNSQVILAVFNDEWHQGESHPEENDRPFDAYYADDCVSAEPVANYAPVADFEMDPESPDTDDNIQFTDTSSDSDGTIVYYDWDFGDGNTSTIADPIHSYDQKGIYTISLTVEDDDGATTEISRDVVVAEPGYAADVVQTIFNRGFRLMPGWDAAQEFIPTFDVLSSVDLYLSKFGSPTGDVTVQICEDTADGTVVFEGVISPGDVPSFPDYEWVTVDISDITVTIGNTYYIVLKDAVGADTHNCMQWGWCDSYASGSGGPYDGGWFWFRKEGNPTWSPIRDWDFNLISFALE